MALLLYKVFELSDGVVTELTEGLKTNDYEYKDGQIRDNDTSYRITLTESGKLNIELAQVFYNEDWRDVFKTEMLPMGEETIQIVSVQIGNAYITLMLNNNKWVELSDEASKDSPQQIGNYYYDGTHLYNDKIKYEIGINKDTGILNCKALQIKVDNAWIDITSKNVTTFPDGTGLIVTAMLGGVEEYFVLHGSGVWTVVKDGSPAQVDGYKVTRTSKGIRIEKGNDRYTVTADKDKNLTLKFSQFKAGDKWHKVYSYQSVGSEMLVMTEDENGELQFYHRDINGNYLWMDGSKTQVGNCTIWKEGEQWKCELNDGLKILNDGMEGVITGVLNINIDVNSKTLIISEYLPLT